MVFTVNRDAILCALYGAIDDEDWSRVRSIVADDVSWTLVNSDVLREVRLETARSLLAWLTDVAAGLSTAHTPRRLLHDEETSVAIVDVLLTAAGRAASIRVVDVFRFDDDQCIAEVLRTQVS